MPTPQRTELAHPTTDDGSLRRRFKLLAGATAVLALLHFIDHVIRGELVVNRGLNPDWNHSGWPFNTESDAPFVLPVVFVVVFGLLLGGILFTWRGRRWAAYWLATSIFLIGILAFVHFIGSGNAETPSVIAMSHQHIALAVLALIDLFGLFAVLAALALQAITTRQRTGHW